jgi:hypothetical protein
MTEIEKKLRTELKPLYQNLLNDNTFENICSFCVQWGENFSLDKHTGILFVGKAVNGWVNAETDIDVLFGNSNERIIARNDQMKWVHDLEGSNEDYNTKKSAFWRVIKKISNNYFPSKWYSHVAWSNLCKIAPFKGGNPSDRLYDEQLDSCLKILQKEIEILSPRVVVMFTSGWEKDFLFYLNDNNKPTSEKTVEWNGYETNLYKIKGFNYIASPHPQGKPEDKHVNVIIDLIESIK